MSRMAYLFLQWYLGSVCFWVVAPPKRIQASNSERDGHDMKFLWSMKSRIREGRVCQSKLIAISEAIPSVRPSSWSSCFAFLSRWYHQSICIQRPVAQSNCNWDGFFLLLEGSRRAPIWLNKFQKKSLRNGPRVDSCTHLSVCILFYCYR